jgi:hypothetical protein
VKDFDVLAEHFKSIGVDVTAEELELLQLHQWEQTQDRLAAAGDPGYEDTEVVNDFGKVIGFIVGAALGLFFLPGLGIGIAGGLQAALIGGAIGAKLVGGIFGEGGRDQAVQTTTDPIYNFTGGGSLIELGSPVPKVYGNRSINPEGGIYLRDPGQIYSRVISRQGSRYLRQMFVLAYGQLGEVNQAGLLIDDKPRTDWEVTDIVTEVSPGTHDQAALGGIDHYSQAVNLSTNAFLGLSPQLVAEIPDITRDAPAFQAVVGCTTTVDTITKVAVSAAWDAGARSPDMLLNATYGSYLYATATGGSGNRWAIGLSTTNTSPNLATMNIGVEIDGSTYRVWQSGTQVATGTAASTTVVIQYYTSFPAGSYHVMISNAVVYTGSLVLAGAIFADFSIWSGALTAVAIDNATHTPTTGIAPGYGRRFALAAAALSKLKADQVYASGTTLINVTQRNLTANWIEFANPIWIQDQAHTGGLVPIVAPGRSINKIYRSTFTTSKKVNQIDVILAASIFAKNNDGKDVPHAQAFEITVDAAGGASYILGRLLILSSSEQQLIRQFSINNLPKNVYTVRLVALEAAEIMADIQSLEDKADTATISTGVTISGNAITMSAEFGPVVTQTNAKTYLGFDNKAQTSGDRGASVQVTHLNEIVYADKVPSYPGYTVAYVELLASDRLQQAPSLSWDVPKGAIIPNYLQYSKTIASTGMSVTMIDKPDGILIGDYVRVLGIGQWQITMVSSFSVGIGQEITTEPGDEVVIFRMGSSCYFPDIYVDGLINKESGLGNYVDQDYFIHYESIVYARKFCKANNLYFDAVFNTGSFEQWATASASSSLLFATELDGKYALLTQEAAPPKPFLFNDGNTSKYTEAGVPWSSGLTTSLLVKYQTNLGREQQQLITTGVGAEVIQPLSTQGITAKNQAIKVGQVALQSLRFQQATCQIETDVDNGLYVRQGDIVRTQHAVTQNDYEKNGFILSVGEEGITLSETIEILPESRIAVSYRASKNSDENLTIEQLPNGNYNILGLSEPLQPGDLWILGVLSIQEKLWRITSLQPDVGTNTVKLGAIEWSDKVLGIDGLILP